MSYKSKALVDLLLHSNTKKKLFKHRLMLLNLSCNVLQNKTTILGGRHLLLRLMSASAQSNKDVGLSSGQFSDDSDSELESVVTELKNVSRLPPERYLQYHGHAPATSYKDMIHRHQRFASYGKASGEDPRIMWPSRSVIHRMEEEEKREESTVTLSERLNQVQMEIKTAEEEKLERRKRIEHNMNQMPKWIAEYKQKQSRIQMEAKERALKKEALLEEARDYFGYKIQANDPKFQQMVEEKVEKERAEAKKRKKEEKAKKLAARLGQDMDKVTKTEEKTRL